MTRTKRNQPKLPFQERLMLETNRLKDEANKLPHGPLRDAMIQKAHQTETAMHVDRWVSSPRLRAPT